MDDETIDTTGLPAWLGVWKVWLRRVISPYIDHWGTKGYMR